MQKDIQKVIAGYNEYKNEYYTQSAEIITSSISVGVLIQATDINTQYFWPVVHLFKAAVPAAYCKIFRFEL